MKAIEKIPKKCGMVSDLQKQKSINCTTESKTVTNKTSFGYLFNIFFTSIAANLFQKISKAAKRFKEFLNCDNKNLIQKKHMI